MRIWSKIAFVAMAPLLLTGCLWGPGKFQSELTLNKNGTFVLDYRGEVILQMPNDAGQAVPWDDKMVRCYKDGSVRPATADMKSFDDDEDDEDAGTESADTRPCSSAELATEKARHEKEEAARLAKKDQESAEMAKLFGLPGGDEDSNRAFAARLQKQAGWKSVTYRGKGVFDVIYRFEGSAKQDFAFPLMPDSDLLIPFVIIRPRGGGTVIVSAPAFTGGSGPLSARAKMMGLPDKGNDGPKSRAEGRFAIITNGEILTNNSEDGPTWNAAGRRLQWDVDPASDKVPEALIRL